MDNNNESVVEHIQNDSINTYIGEVSQELFQNDMWEIFNPDEIAETSLEVAANRDNCSIEDEGARHFRRFLSIATNFSSLPFAERLQIVPELVENIKQLLENMIKEVHEYSDMAHELRELIQYFVQMVMQVKQNVNMMLPLLSTAKAQITIVQDVMNTNVIQALNEIDKRDIQLALDRMSIGIQKLLNLAETSKAESWTLDERIGSMTNSVQSKKMIVERRLKVARNILKCGTPLSAIAPPVAVGGCVAAPVLGGVGALVIGGLVIPPVAAIAGALVLGGVVAGTIFILVRKLWIRHQRTAVNYLQKILERLFQLNSANVHFMTYMTDIKEKANQVSEHTDDIKQYLESERFRRANRDVCTVALDSMTAMIESLEKISTLDMSKWIDTSNAIRFSRTISIPNAIMN